MILLCYVLLSIVCVFFFQAEDGIRDLVRSRGLGDVYKRQEQLTRVALVGYTNVGKSTIMNLLSKSDVFAENKFCLLYTSDAADERSSVDLGGRRIIKKKKTNNSGGTCRYKKNKTMQDLDTNLSPKD